MECGVQSAMISVPSGGDPAASQPLATAIFPPADADQAQFEADKRAVYKHPLFPLLALLFERCELATQSSEPQSSDAFNLDIQAFVQHQERDRKPFLANEPEIDGLMIKAIQVLRIHLLELEKVQELCKDFCNRYITCLKGKMQSENLLRSDYPQDVAGAALMNNLESNNNNNTNSMMSHGNSDSGSASNSPVQYSISPSQPVVSTTPLMDGRQLDTTSTSPYGGGTAAGPPLSSSHYNTTTSTTNNSSSSNGPTPPLSQMPPHPLQQQAPASCENLVIHGSTPLSQIGANICPVPPPSDSSGPMSPAPTTPGGSADDCGDDSNDFNSPSRGGLGGGGRKQKRGVLPKHATSVMRSWLFQHLVHPYPTEDEKRHIAAQTNLTLLQVNNWFINARRRILQPMLDASAPTDNATSGVGSSPNHHHKKKNNKSQNNNRRFWPQDFANIHPQIDSGMLLSSDDDGDSYSSDGEEGSLVIDSGGGGAPPQITTAPSGVIGEISQNGHHHPHHHQQQQQVDPLSFATANGGGSSPPDVAVGAVTTSPAAVAALSGSAIKNERQ